ncbi:hypothetical protein PybrP1_003673 [[Pythium] brassicae (nom. inval.)]|nr:hypothetical protein PybrP1_003673 [[Pythium] brassicae (nom. inval.)]
MSGGSVNSNGSRRRQANESAPLLEPGALTLNYNSDSAVSALEARDQVGPMQHRHFYYGPGTHYSTTVSSDDDDDGEDDGEDDSDDARRLDFRAPGYTLQASEFAGRPIPRANWRSLVNRKSKRTKLRVSAYCTCDQLQLFKLLKWLERVETGQLPGGELNPNGWSHKMYMGAIHSTCAPIVDETDDMVVPAAYRQKDVFYFATGCTVFWGLTRTEEQGHLRALTAFSVGPVKQIEVEDMDYTYGEATSIVNDAITLSSNLASEKLAISFAMAQSAKLDVFEERVEETIQQTKHIPQNLATTGSIHDVNLNSDMLDEPDFFWEDDEYEPLYKKMMRYLDVENRVQILNTRLDILRELLDVLSQQLAHQHDTKLEWIVIWLIVAEVVVQIVWNIIIKDILGFFPRSDTE